MQEIDRDHINVLAEDDITKCIREIGKKRPLVHCITNQVTVNDCANILLAAGARPTMAHAPQEVKEITAGSNALVLNMGATEYYSSMPFAVEGAMKAGIPVVIDPVGCGGSAYRREMVAELVRTGAVTCIRGNASEIKALAQEQNTVIGVDADSTDIMKERASIAMELAKRTGSIVVLSGEVDIVTEGEEVYYIDNGDEMMSRITGSGCMATAIIGAYLSVAGTKKAMAVASAMTMLGRCGEKAAKRTRYEERGTMTFRQHFIDEVYLLSEAIVNVSR